MATLKGIVSSISGIVYKLLNRNNPNQPKVFYFEQLKKQAEKEIQAIMDGAEEGFKALSAGQVQIAPVVHLDFEDPQGSYCVKSGFIKQEPYFIIKCAGGFSKNQELYNVSTTSGCMLVFCKKTGHLRSVLCDEGYLTDIRTAVAGAIAAKYLANPDVEYIGIIGTGIQARFQAQLLKEVVKTRKLVLWGRTSHKAQACTKDMEAMGFNVEISPNVNQLAEKCRLIVLTTESRKALLMKADVKPGTHITAMGCDTAGKQELDPELLTIADSLIADSKQQCEGFGEFSYLEKNNLKAKSNIIELGDVLSKPNQHGRKALGKDAITIFDSTGVAVQDVMIATMVYEKLK